jgi:REP element-mobilizing transposase RayT
VGSGAVFFVTICAERRGNLLLRAPKIPAALLSAAQHYHGKRWWCRLWLVMPDHVHGLISPAPDDTLSAAVGDWKRFTSTSCGVCWQENFFDHRLRSHEQIDLKAAYIRANPRRAGLIGETEVWPWQWEPNSFVAPVS